MYDRLLTVEREVRLNRGRRVSLASILCWLMQLAACAYLWLYVAMIMTQSCQVGVFIIVTYVRSLMQILSGQLFLSLVAGS